MKPERKIIVSEHGKLVMKNIALSFKDSEGQDLYILEQEKQNNSNKKLYEQIENNFLLIGLLKKVDLSEMSQEKVDELMFMKHEKEENFLSAGRKRGFDLNVDMDPEEILRFYISLTPEERVSFNCKP